MNIVTKTKLFREAAINLLIAHDMRIEQYKNYVEENEKIIQQYVNKYDGIIVAIQILGLLEDYEKWFKIHYKELKRRMTE